MKLPIQIKHLILVIIVAAFTACGGNKSELIKNISPNKKVEIKISGERFSSIEPWKVELIVKAYNFKEGKLAFEVYADGLNTETIKFNWLDDENCSIAFTESDGKERIFKLHVTSQQLDLSQQ